MVLRTARARILALMTTPHELDARATFRYIAFMAQSPPVVLTIAGFDPSSGAGVTADIKTIAAHGCYGVGCITALTVQSTAGVRRVEAVSPELVTDTLRELKADLEISAVHIGMLGRGRWLARSLIFWKRPGCRMLFSIRSSSRLPGHDLIDAAGMRVLIERLLPLATVITPNVDEAAALTGLEVTNLEQMRAAATRLHQMGCGQRRHHWRPPGQGNRPVEFHQPDGARSRRSSSPTGYGRTPPTAPAARSPRRWRAIWRGAADCRRPCCWPRPTSRPRLPMAILWDAASGRCIICIACISRGG